MANIIKMESKEFLKSFVDEFDHRKFVIVLASDQIKCKKKCKYENVYNIKSLNAPGNIWNALLANDDLKKFQKKYKQYISMPENAYNIAAIVKVAIADNIDVIILTSNDESKSGMLEVIGKYIEKTYKVDVCSYKQYKKNPKKYNNRDNKKFAIKKLCEILRAGTRTDYQVAITKKDTRKILETMSKDDLKAAAKSNDIKIKKGMGRKEIIKAILDNV